MKSASGREKHKSGPAPKGHRKPPKPPEPPQLQARPVPVSGPSRQGDNGYVTHVVFTPAAPPDTARGLLGYVQCVMHGTLQVDGLTLWRTLDGRLTLSYPARQHRGSDSHFVVWPVDDCARREIERQIFIALGSEVAS